METGRTTDREGIANGLDHLDVVQLFTPLSYVPDMALGMLLLFDPIQFVEQVSIRREMVTRHAFEEIAIFALLLQLGPAAVKFWAQITVSPFTVPMPLAELHHVHDGLDVKLLNVGFEAFPGDSRINGRLNSA